MNMKFDGDKFKKTMRRHQTSIAEHFGISSPAVSKKLREPEKLRIRELIEICEYAGQNPRDFFVGNDKLRKASAMINDTTKRTIKNLGEGIIQRAEEMPDQPQDVTSLIQNWAYINSYINGRIEVIKGLLEDIETQEKDRIRKEEE